jgi:hypothetical protein
LQKINHLASKIIILQQQYIKQLGFVAHVHFELEGCFDLKNANINQVDLAKLNQLLHWHHIDGEFVYEYWQNQWEFVSAFNGQSPLTEASNLEKVITNLPLWLKQVHNTEINTLIKPVVWSGDNGQLADKSSAIFSPINRDVHIPNAIQINISASKVASAEENSNIIATTNLGEYLQQSFLQTSLPCCLLYLPEEEAFERLLLKTKYGLAQELCSPIDISGGYQGSIALYRKKGKHNQKLGQQPLLYDQNNNVLISEYKWQQTARVEHRLGASSLQYNTYVNVVFALANLISAIEKYLDKAKLEHIAVQTLPLSLRSSNTQLGAIDLFKQESWFAATINGLEKKLSTQYKNTLALDFNDTQYWGTQLKAYILDKYQVNIITPIISNKN